MKRTRHSFLTIGFALLAAPMMGCSAPAIPAPATATAVPTTVSVPSLVPAPTVAPSPRGAPSSTPGQPTVTPTGRPSLVATQPATATSLRATPTIGRQPRSTVAAVVTSSIPFSFSPAIAPLGDPLIAGIVVDPSDSNIWYVNGQNGLYITRDGGITWSVNKEIPASIVTLSLQDPSQVYAGVRERLYFSGDKGRTWKVLGTFDAGTSIRSLHASRDGTILVGLHWADLRKSMGNPEGVYVSRDRGASWQLSSFATTYRGLIVWAINQDPRDGTLYAGTEIYDHPQPYHPPLFRSSDAGKTWQDISGIVDWHVLAIQIHPTTGYLYAMTEGHGIYGSSDHGDHWTLFPANVAVTLLLDPKFPNRLWGSAFSNALGQFGGVYLSINGGTSFEQIGLPGVTITGLSLNGDSTILYLAVQNSGIVTSKISLSAR